MRALKGLEPVVALTRRGWQVRVGGAAALLVLGWLTIRWRVLVGEGHPVEMILSVLPWLPGVPLALAAWRRLDALSNPLVECLARTPQRIYWVFADEIEGVPTRNVYFHRADGSSYVLPAVDRAELPELMRALKRQLPHARFGYTEVARKRYGTNPRLVLDLRQEEFPKDIISLA